MYMRIYYISVYVCIYYTCTVSYTHFGGLHIRLIIVFVFVFLSLVILVENSFFFFFFGDSSFVSGFARAFRFSSCGVNVRVNNVSFDLDGSHSFFIFSILSGVFERWVRRTHTHAHVHIQTVEKVFSFQWFCG